MINWEEFNTNILQTLGYNFVNTTMIELLLNGDKNENPADPSYEERMTSIKNAIAQLNYPAIKFHVHSYKGVIVNFYDEEAVELASLLETMGFLKTGGELDEKETVKFVTAMKRLGIENTDEGLTEIFELLKVSSDKLLSELKQFRKSHS